jgi:hypothetical protein
MTLKYKHVYEPVNNHLVGTIAYDFVDNGRTIRIAYTSTNGASNPTKAVGKTRAMLNHTSKVNYKEIEIESLINTEIISNILFLSERQADKVMKMITFEGLNRTQLFMWMINVCFPGRGYE